MNKSLDPARESPPAATADCPNEGAVVLAFDGGDQVKFTNALHWVEDGEHIISSTEFQVASSGGTFADAFLQMVDNLLQEARSLGKLIEDAKAAPNEREEALALFTRLQEIVSAEEKVQRRSEQAATKPLKRRRGAAAQSFRSRQWQIQPKNRRHSASALPA